MRIGSTNHQTLLKLKDWGTTVICESAALLSCVCKTNTVCPVTCLASSTFGACPITYLHGNYFLIMCIYENQGLACFSHSLGYIQSHISRECVFIEHKNTNHNHSSVLIHIFLYIWTTPPGLFRFQLCLKLNGNTLTWYNKAHSWYHEFLELPQTTEDDPEC